MRPLNPLTEADNSPNDKNDIIIILYQLMSV